VSRVPKPGAWDATRTRDSRDAGLADRRETPGRPRDAKTGSSTSKAGQAPVNTKLATIPIASSTETSTVARTILVAWLTPRGSREGGLRPAVFGAKRRGTPNDRSASRSRERVRGDDRSPREAGQRPGDRPDPFVSTGILFETDSVESDR